MELAAPSLPVPVSLAICWGALGLVLVQIWRFRDLATAFLFLSIWMRYSIAAFHEFTYPPLVLGFSIAAMSSAFVVGVGLAVVGVRPLFLRKLRPIYAIMFVILISGSVNEQWIGAINELVKYLYLTVLALAAFIAISRHGSGRIFGALTVVFVGPIVSQLISVAMGLHLTNEDGTVCFIGGYQQEQMFSIIILTFLFVTCFTPQLNVTSMFFRLAVAAGGLALANYRTSILAAVLPSAALVISTLMGRVVQRQRDLVFVMVGALTVFVLVGIADLAQERFADLGKAANKGASLIQPPQYFTTDERRLFSGRAYLWSQYIDAHLQGTIIERLVGFGPGAWVGRFPLYAHNTFVSYLYELGLIGMAAFVWFICANLLTAARASDHRRLVLIACHGGFIVLNLATMPMWTIEGEILYALLLAQTWYVRSFRSTGDKASIVQLGPMPSARNAPETA
jgi:hypothetical protein